MPSSRLLTYLFAGAVVSGTAVQAQEMTLGEFEYRNSCVACHGTSGKGDGPVTDFLSGATVPDLTVLQSNNGGVFPVSAVYEAISGAEVASAHGTRDMPIWGSRFRERAADSNDPHFSVPGAQLYANTRILALIEYLASIQAE
ncbi:MAG: cytochrome c [Paracoccaceae bacterium]|nr:cytochrome c [Paracoccaceae bacterium]